jgi:CBS domain containing-hemolysin-like protein
MVAGILLCLAFEALFSGSEIALVSADRLSLRARADAGSAGANLALQLLAREDLLLGTCLIGTNLSLVSGTTLVTLLLDWYHVEFSLGAALIYTPIALIFCENLSKTVFQHHADALSPWVATPVRAAQILFLPVLPLLGLWSRALEAVLGRDHREPVRKEEIADLLAAEEKGDIDQDDRKIIRNLMFMSETPVIDAMTPLVHVQAVDAAATIAEATAMAVETGHARLPVYRDRIDNIVGLITTRALLGAASALAPVHTLMEPASFVPEQKRVDALLGEMRKNHLPLAVVVDEYGGSVGIVTAEDLLEQVVGEIHDEGDEREPVIQKIGEFEWRIPGYVTVEEVAETLDHPLPEGDYETVAGLLLARTGKILRKGESASVGEVVFVVEEATDRAITCVRARRTTPPVQGTRSSSPG